MPGTLALGRLRQEDGDFEASKGYLVSLCSERQTRRQSQIHTYRDRNTETDRHKHMHRHGAGMTRKGVGSTIFLKYLHTFFGGFLHIKFVSSSPLT